MLAASPEAEQFVYLLNLARHNPTKFASDFGLSADLSQVAARPPLALSDTLTEAATGRAQELAQYNYFQDQSTVTGKWPNQLAREAGYALPAAWPNTANFIESLAAGSMYTTGDVPLRTLLTDADESSLIHQRQLLGIDEAFAANREIGVGQAFSASGTFGNYWAVETAHRETAAPFLTGVVFSDANQNGQYDPGEGLGDVTVTAGGTATTTNAAGGWSLQVAPGTYSVTATGPNLPLAAAAKVQVGQDNVELDFLADRQRGLVNFAGWQNSLEPADVNADGRQTPLDALLLINNVNLLGPRQLAGLWTGSTPSELFWDVSGDGQVSPLDVLQVIDDLNAVAFSFASAAGESQGHTAAPSGTPNSSATPVEGESPTTTDFVPKSLTTEQLVNTLIPRLQTTGDQASSVATNASGAYVVTYSGKGPTDADGVWARRYDSTGAAQGDVFRVNTTAREGQQSPSVAMADDGSFLIAWDGRGPGDQRGIFAQWYDPAGHPRGIETRINTTTGGIQELAAVAMAADGQSVVVWQGVGTGDLDGIFVQRFAVNGTPVGGETLVNTCTTGQQAYPSAAMDGRGELVVTWSSRHQDGSDWGVFAQRFAADGSRLGSEFQVNSQVAASQYDSSVAMGSDGDFVVTWNCYNTSRAGWDIYARGFEADGRAYGKEILVNTRQVGQTRDPHVGMLLGGGFVVTWTGGEPNGAAWEVYGRTYAATYEADTDAYQINTLTLGPGSGHQQYASFALGSGPRALIVWSGRGHADQQGVYADLWEVGRINRPPVLDPILHQTIEEQTQLTITAHATDPDLPLNTLRFSLDAGAPTGTVIDPITGAFTWTPTESQGPGEYSVVVRVTDSGQPNMSDAVTVGITVREINRPPVLDPILPQLIDEQTKLTFTAHATDPDLPANSLRYNLDVGSLAAGMTIDLTSGQFTWTPSEAQGPGEYTVVVRVTDDGQPALSVSRTVGITVREVNRPPVLDPIPHQTVDEETLLTFTAHATDPDLPLDTLRFSLDAGVPTGTAIDPSTGEFTWTPTELQGPGEYSVVVRVTENGLPALSTTQTVAITVNEVNRPPVLDPIPSQTIPAGELISLKATASDPDIPANGLTFRLGAGAPAGATIDPVSGLFTWTPTNAQLGQSYAVTVEVVDDGLPSLMDQTTFSVQVSNSCTFPQGLPGWTTGDSGGTAQGHGTVLPQACKAVMTEGDSFLVTLQKSFTIPAEPSALRVTFDNLSFDTTDPNFVNDAFEMALVDQDGNSLVGSFASGRDAFFNVSEGLPASYASGIQVAGNRVTVGLNGLPAGLMATAIFRLVNNDSDHATTVRITDFAIIAGALPAPLPSPATPATSDIPASQAAESDVGVVTPAFQPASSPLPSPPYTGPTDESGGQAGFTSDSPLTPDNAPTPSNADLIIKDLVTSALFYNGQLLTISGTISATVTNQGTDAVNSPFSVLFFEDLNGNQRYDSGIDNALGSTQVAALLSAGQSVPVTAQLSGHVQFSSNVIWGFVDSSSVVAESDEANNTARTSSVVAPQSGQFNPVVEWSKSTFTVRPQSNQVTTTPAVVDLNGDAVPDLVFSTFNLDLNDANANTNGVLRAVSGANGAELWNVTDSAYEVSPLSSIAVGDIDSDNRPEIVAVHESGVLIAFEHDGSFKWKSPPISGGIRWGGASIADLTGDGIPEIVVGATVLNNDGTIRWEGSNAGGLGRGDNWIDPRFGGPLSCVADIDMDGSMEVVAGKSAYRANGSLYWNSAVPDGFPAVGNFDGDPFPEIVVVASGNLYLLEHTGQVKWGPVAIPGGGRGGAPTISDVDGDGDAEIGVAGASRYVMFETDGSIKWQKATQDISSNATGSSVFDFEGDGKAEVVYADERFLRVYRGEDGSVLYERAKGSGTSYEYPVIADVDGDGNAEIVAVANQILGYGTDHGIIVIGDANHTWVPTRQIWNQHTYHITNVNDDGTIPIHEQNSWQVSNTYRLNAQPGLNPLRTADLTASYLRAGGTYQNATLTARIGNGGELFVAPAISVAFYSGDPEQGGTLLGKTVTKSRLEPGQFEDVSISVPQIALTDIWVVADDDGAGKGQVRESDETNNVHHAMLTYLAPEVTVTSPTDGCPITAGTTVVISGHAAAPPPDLGGIPASLPNRIAAVLINGTAADVVDAAGNYFARVLILPGRNTFELTALDAYGQSASARFTVEGTQNPGGGSAQILFDVSPGFAADYARTSFDEQNRLLYAELAIRNQGEHDADNPFFVGVRNISDPTVTVRNIAGVTSDGIPYYDFSPAVPGNSLAPNEISGYVNAVFHNPNRVPFKYELVFLAKLNERPVFTSTPIVETSAGGSYAYDADATDPDGDTLSYSLVSAPPSLQINPATGVITWFPATGDLGVQSISVRVADGRGGAAEQRYLLSVVDAPPNRPPVITTLPVTEAAVLTTYRYDVDAVDPDSDSVTYSFTRGETYAESVLADAPIGYWRLGETSGTTATDASGNHRDATYSGAIGLGRSGSLEQDADTATAFDGSTARLAIPYTPPKNNFTIEAWVQTSLTHQIDSESTSGTQGTSGQRFLFEPDYRGSEGGAGLSVGTNGISVYEHGSTYLPATAVYSGNVGSGFVHVVVTYTNKQPRIYLNGTLVRTGLISPKANVWAPTALALHSYGRFAGTVDEVAIYDKPLTPDQILHHYQRGTSGPPLPPPPAGMTINGTTGEILWTPTANDVGSHVVSVLASDARGGTDHQTFVVVVSPQPGNHPPVIVSEPVTTLVAPSVIGATPSLYSYQLAAVDPDRDAVTYALVTGPQGMSIDPTSGLVSWSVTSSDVGAHPVTVQAGDDRGGFDVQSFTVNATAAGTGEIRGTKFNDINGDGERNQTQTTTLADGDFVSGAWDSQVLFIGSPTNAANVTVQHTGGNPGDYRQTEHVTVVGDRLLVKNRFVAQTYNPRSDGPISKIDFSLDLRINAGAVVCLLYAEQGGTSFYAPIPYYLGFSNQSWNSFHLSDLTVWDFDTNWNVAVGRPADGPTGVHPDFSANGDPIVFGYALTNSAFGPPGARATGITGADNFVVRFYRGDPGLQGWTVYIDGNQNGRRDPGEPSTVTDQNGDYAFTGLPPATYVVAEEPKPGWRQTAPQSKTYVVTLAAGQIAAGKDFGNSIVIGTNQSPEFTSDSPNTVDVDQLLRYPAVAVDPNNDPLTFDLPLAPEGMTVHPELGIVVWQPTREQAGTHQVVLRVQDGQGGVDIQSFTITVVPPNSPPVITSTPPDPAVANLPYVYQVSAQDADAGDTLTFRLQDPLAGMVIDAVTGRFTWTPTSAQIGNQTVTIVASDGHLGSEAVQTFTLAVVATAPNDPPAIDSTPRQRARVGQPYVYLVEATDPNGDPLSYHLDTAPAGMTIDAGTGIVNWTPASQLLGTTQAVIVRVDDGRGGSDTQSFSLQVVTQDTNSAPRVVSNPPLVGLVGRSYVYNLAAEDPEGDPLVWSLDQSPLGMSIDSLRGTIRWTPAADQAGPNEVVVQVRDIFYAASTQSFTIAVRAVNLPPTIDSNPLVVANPNELYAYAPRATDPDGDSVTFRLSAKPDGMTIDARTGLIQWTPTTAQIGPRTVGIVVEDGQGGIDSQAYTLDVRQTAVNRPPLITSTPVYKANVGRAYQYTVTSTDPEAQPITYSLDLKPDGMTIDPATGVITWTPDAVPADPPTVTVVAADPAGALGKQTFLLTVRPNQPPQITQPPSQTLIASRTYRYDVRATDADHDPITFQLDAGPTGLTMDWQGRITWATTSADAGTHTIRFTARDNCGGTDTASFELTVTLDTERPQVLLGASTNLTDLGKQVTFQVQASDNVEVQTLGLMVGGKAVALDSQNSATVTMDQAGLIDVVGTATDAAGNVGTSAPWQVRVIDRSDVTYPQVEITALVQGNQRIEGDALHLSPVLTYLADVYGSVQDSNLEFWRLEYARADLVDVNNFAADDPDFVALASGTTPVVNQKLAQFDPTLVANDAYVFRLYAQDTNGLINTRGVLFDVSGEAKLGNFHLDFTDVTLPLAGIPITITRSYDTLNARAEGDFGYGWTLGIQEANIRETVPAGAGSGLFSTGHPFIPEKTRVFLTNPDGKRIGFTYYEELIQAGLISANFAPRFRPDPGVYDTLEAEGIITRGLGGFMDYNPDEYVLTTKDGLKYRYSQSVGLQSITDPNGTKLTFTKDAITHSSGAKIDLVRDFRGRIKEIVAPDGTSVKYTYNAAGDLLSFTNQAGEVTTYGYLADPKHPHFLDTITDSHSVKVFQAEFDDNGRLKGSTDALGNTVSQDFNPGSYTGTITDAKGSVTELLYNERGNVLEKREPNPDDPLHPLVTKYEYGDSRNPDKETKIVDRNGVVETRVFDAAGNMTLVKRAVGTPLETTTAYVYNARGDVTSLQQNGQTPTVFDYDSAGKLTEIVNAVGGVASATHDASGRQVGFTDLNGNRTTYDYKDGCACGSPKKITYADGTYEQFAYNGYGQVTRHDVFEADGTLVETSSTAYDELGRTIEETQGVGTSKTVVQKHYDGNSLDWEIIVNPDSPNETPATPLAQRKSRITDYAYDAAGRLITQTDAEGGAVQFRYDANANRVLLEDPVGNITTWVYNAQNKVVEERDPFYWVDYVSAHPARFAGKSGDLFLAEIVSANTEPSGASAKVNLGAEHVRVYAYDGEGNQTKIIDRDQRRREFTYDPLNRLTEERWYDPDRTLVRTIVSTYDAVGNLKSITDPDSTYTYTYDVLNRVVTVDNAGTPDMPHVILTYSYDAMGNVISTSDNLGVTVRSTYDSRNRLAKRRWEGAVDPARVDFLYTAAGREKHIDRYADLAGTNRVGYTDRTYDTAGRSKDIVHRDAVDAVLAEYHYQYDFGGLLKHEDRLGDWHADYSYDHTGQLLGAHYSGADVIPEQVNEYYTYDANGNRTTSYLHGTGYRTGTANELLTDGTYNYAYDGEGNMVRKVEIATGQVTIFEYDHRNRMFRATIWSSDPASGGVILHQESYRYDALGRRIAILSDGQVTKTIYNGDNAWADFDATNVVTARYLFGNRIDQLIAQYTPGTGTTWALTDHLGTVREIVGPTGQVINRIAYTTFGQVLRQTNSALLNRYRFTGREFDSTMNVYYYRSRSYWGTVGRFATNDSIGFAGGDTNLYRYGHNSPLLSTDPTGKEFLEEALLFTLAVAPPLFGAWVASVTLNYDCPYLDETGDYLITLIVGAQAGAALGISIALAFFTVGASLSIGVTLVGFLAPPVTATLLCEAFNPNR